VIHSPAASDDAVNPHPLVTVVTPSYNHAHFIEATIQSVLSQDYPNLEYIVMDGGSTDDTARVVAPYLDRLKFISEKDRGQSHAINKGFAMAQGSIVAWLNSDDLFLPGSISKAVETFVKHPNAGVVYGEGYQIDFDGNVKSRFPHTQRFDLWRLTHMSDYILQQSVFFRKAALDHVGPIREDLHYIMDWEILIRLGKEFDFVYVPEFFGSLREYGATKTSQGGAKRATEIRHMLRAHTGKFLPEGYIVYGLETYASIWLGQIESWPSRLGPLKRFASRVVARLCYGILGRVLTHAQGVYTDGWLGKAGHFMLRQGQGEIVFVGEAPNVPQSTGQRIRVSCNGVVCADREIGPGSFEVRFEAPREAVARATTFDVVTSKAFVPAQISASQDIRTLSVLIKHFDWADAPGVSGSH
jgi:glycosyltransferase involved in cell wall biosynthesis